MRKIHLMFYLALLPVVSSAQDRIGYSYDASGNRIKREIVMQVPKAMAKQQNFSSDNQSFSDMLHDHSIKIYPNPTKGALRICISGAKRDGQVLFRGLHDFGSANSGEKSRD